MEMVKLSNGATVPKATMITTFERLKAFNIMVFVDLVEFAKDSNYKIGKFSEHEIKESLIVKDGIIHNDIKNIILSSYEGEGINMKLKHPMAQNDNQ